MMERQQYSNWLSRAWSLDELAVISEHRGKSRGQQLYTEAQLVRLRKAYVSLDRAPTIAGAFDALLSTVLEPYLPEPEKRTGVGIFFRDWPIPCLDDDCFAPDERGAALVRPDIMTGSIGRVFGPQGHRYRTLLRGFTAAQAVAARVGSAPESLEAFVRGCVVGDLVKVQALFKTFGGAPFDGALSKRSCHTWGMYRFAGERFADEVEHLGLELVVGFGAPPAWQSAMDVLKSRGWNIYRPTNGTRQLMSPMIGRRLMVLLPHPQAWGKALERAVQTVTGSASEMPDAPEPTTEKLETQQEPPEPADEELGPSETDGDNAFYAHIEAWLESQFGDWEVHPHNTSSMRSFKPQGRRCGAIYNKTRRGRKLVFPCTQQEKWAPDGIPGFDIRRGENGRIVVYLPKDEDLAPLDALLQDWE